MKNILFLLPIIIILFGCTQKPVDAGKFKGCEEYIQNYAADNINPDWFSKDKPTGNIEVNEVQIVKVLPIKEDDNSALITVMLKGTKSNKDSESSTRKFNLRKDFKVTQNPNGFSVRPLSMVEG